MKLKIDAITRTRSATQDGVRDKLAIRAQVLDVGDLDDALELAGQVVEATFARQQPLLFEEDSKPTEEAPVAVPSPGRRRNGTRSSEQAARTE